MGAIGALIALWLASFVPFPSYTTPSEANLPTLRPGDHVRVNRWAYAYGSPDRGDVVIYEAPGGGGPARRVSRIVAVGGDTVEGRGGRLVRNGTVVDEGYLADGATTSDFGPVTVPDGSVFLLSDNRRNSQDSRYFGPVPEANLHGRVLLITRPLGHIGTV